MSLATTEALVATVLSSVSGVGNVRDRMLTLTDREEAEAVLIAAGIVNLWEYEVDTEQVLDGADGLYRDEVLVKIRVHYQHDDANDSRGDLRDLLQAVQRALVDVDNGFVQIKAPGVQLVQRPTLVKTATGHSAYQAELQFRLWNFQNT